MEFGRRHGIKVRFTTDPLGGLVMTPQNQKLQDAIVKERLAQGTVEPESSAYVQNDWEQDAVYEWANVSKSERNDIRQGWDVTKIVDPWEFMHHYHDLDPEMINEVKFGGPWPAGINTPSDYHWPGDDRQLNPGVPGLDYEPLDSGPGLGVPGGLDRGFYPPRSDQRWGAADTSHGGYGGSPFEGMDIGALPSDQPWGSFSYYVIFNLNGHAAAAPFGNRGQAEAFRNAVASDPDLRPATVAAALPANAVELDPSQVRALISSSRYLDPQFSGWGQSICSIICPEGGSSGSNAATACSIMCPGRAEDYAEAAAAEKKAEAEAKAAKARAEAAEREARARAEAAEAEAEAARAQRMTRTEEFLTRARARAAARSDAGVKTILRAPARTEGGGGKTALVVGGLAVLGLGAWLIFKK